MSSLIFSPIEEILEALKERRMIICSDDPSRENEADLIAPAADITPEMIAFMATHGRGLICAPITSERADALHLPPMTPKNTESLKTAFTISVDAATGISTGISAADRARTIGLLADESAGRTNFVQPGHVFPLQAVEGGVLKRAGHTEAAIDLMRLAGLPPAGVVCEIMHADGRMARTKDLGDYQKEHGLLACTVSDIIAYRRHFEKIITREQTITLPTDYGDFICHLFCEKNADKHHLALVAGEISPDKPTLVRVHSECLTGDVLGSKRCDCGHQLDAAMRQISEEGGVLIYLRQEGRGIGLPAKIHAYKLQEEGFDTIEANEKLGFASDLREYGIGAQMLWDVGVRQMRLLTNNPKKVIGLEGHGITLVEQIPLTMPANPHNEAYLNTKRDRMGHTL